MAECAAGLERPMMTSSPATARHPWPHTQHYQTGWKGQPQLHCLSPKKLPAAQCCGVDCSPQQCQSRLAVVSLHRYHISLRQFVKTKNSCQFSLQLQRCTILACDQAASRLTLASGTWYLSNTVLETQQPGPPTSISTYNGDSARP